MQGNNPRPAKRDDPQTMRKPQLRLPWYLFAVEPRDPLSRMQPKASGKCATGNDAWLQMHNVEC
jgi:hypothetical protein